MRLGKKKAEKAKKDEEGFEEDNDEDDDDDQEVEQGSEEVEEDKPIKKRGRRRTEPWVAQEVTTQTQPMVVDSRTGKFYTPEIVMAKILNNQEKILTILAEPE